MVYNKDSVSYTMLAQLNGNILDGYYCRKVYKLSWTRNQTNTLVNGPCHFIDGYGRAPVALVSFEGSGNTWLRGLLEKATGICTGICMASPASYSVNRSHI